MNPQLASADPSSWPPVDTSYYVQYNWINNGITAMEQLAGSLGCDQAAEDNNANHNSLVELDFGQEYSNATGTETFGGGEWSNVTDADFAANFAAGYQGCGNGSHYVFLAMGINNGGNNYAPATAAAMGAQWGYDVLDVSENAAKAGYYDVNVAGGGDWETWGSFDSLSSWMCGSPGCTWASAGYMGATSTMVVNIGSADGCPDYYGGYESGQGFLCSSGDWYQLSNWMDSWGWPNSVVAPEIYYFNSCTLGGQHYPNQAVTWANISEYGSVYQGAAIYFEGPLYSPGFCEVSAQNSYTDLWNAAHNYGGLVAEYATLPYLLQI